MGQRVMARRKSVPQAFDVTDQQVAAVVGERKREEKRSAFELASPIAGHQSFSTRFVGTALRAFARPTFARRLTYQDSSIAEHR